MFDLGLLRKPTFTGGLIAAFGVSASIFSLLTYLVIYVQNVLGLLRGRRRASGSCSSPAPRSSPRHRRRLTEKVPVKWLIAPGFLILGVGLLLIHGIQDDSSWTHLIPGPARRRRRHRHDQPAAGLDRRRRRARRVGHGQRRNSTFRQVGIATGIAALGSIFSQQVADAVRPPCPARCPVPRSTASPARCPAARCTPPPRARSKAAARIGWAARRAAGLRPGHQVGTSAVVDALNHITMIAAVIAFVAGVLCLVLIRQKDFVVRGGPPPAEDDARAARPGGKHAADAPAGLAVELGASRSRPCSCSQTSGSGPLGTMPDGFTSLCTT